MLENIFSTCTFIATVVLLIFYMLRNKSKKQKGKDSIYVVIWWLCILILGSVLYLIAFLETPKAKTQYEISYYISTIITSVRTSIKMFSFDFSYENVKVIADKNWFYCIAIVTCFIAASLWTIIIVTNLFFKGIINEIKLYTKFRQKKDEYHYIVIGCEKSMKVFLSDLEKNVSKNNITIITGEPVEQGVKSTVYFKEFVEDGYRIINGKADEAALKKAGIDNVKQKTRVIAITECDEQNLNVADIITHKIFSIVCPGKEYTDIEIQKETKKSEVMEVLKNINLEAYIMYSFIERTEHFVFAENAFGKVDFFNPYELRVRDFFWKYPITSLIPHLIDTSKARLKGDFRANGKIYKPDGKEYLIKNVFVGFGNANYQMLKGSILTGQLLGCDYHAIIYDENICEEKPSINQAMFVNHSSGLFGGDQTSEGEYFDSPKEKYNIFFKNGNILSKDFYLGAKDGLINEIKNNDFTAIYIALGDDKLSIESACEMRQCLYEHGITQDKIRIFVKIREESVFNKDLVINNPQNIPIKIERFGLDSLIFTKDHIISESLDRFARVVTNKNHETPWEFLAETKRDINRQVAMAIKTKLNLLGFDIVDKDSTDKTVKDKEDKEYEEKYANLGNDKIEKIIELSEKIALCNNELENEQNIEDTKEKLKNLKKERSDYILDYVQTDNGQPDGIISDTPRNNLARLEHLRWNTFYLIHGWTKKPKSKVGMGNEDKRGTDNTGRQNKLTKQHACITTFDELIRLRNLQAKKLCESNTTEISLEKAKTKLDTVWYDYNLMDELPIRLSKSDKKILYSLKPWNT